MAPRKEPKETVVYAASKRKAPPFKPQRPSKAPRTGSQDSGTQHTQPARSAVPSRNTITTSKTNANYGAGQGMRGSHLIDTDSSDSEEELAEDPLAARPKPTKTKPTNPTPARRKPSRQPSPVSVSSNEHISIPPERDDLSPSASQADHPTIPQALLVRLLHEHFADKSTKIDKDAIHVLERYFEVFVREAIARTQLQKEQDAERDGKVGEIDSRWLELVDLEKVAAGMLLDF